MIDLEWTSWRGNYFGKNFLKEKRKKWQKKEIIQIGAIKFDSGFNIIEKFNVYVKPTINPKLSKYIIKLTKITNRKLKNKGINFRKAYLKFKNFTKDCKVICNGDDNKVLKENLKYNKMKEKMIRIKNIKKMLATKYKIPANYLHSPRIQSFFNYKKNTQNWHNALKDCESILNALRAIKYC